MKLPPQPNYTPNPQINKVIKEKAERKEMAIAAMQGLLSALPNPLSLDANQAEIISLEAIMVADSLIKRLNVPQNNQP